MKRYTVNVYYDGCYSTEIVADRFEDAEQLAVEEFEKEYKICCNCETSIESEEDEEEDEDDEDC